MDDLRRPYRGPEYYHTNGVFVCQSQTAAKLPCNCGFEAMIQQVRADAKTEVLQELLPSLQAVRAGFDHWEYDDERGHLEGDPKIVILGRDQWLPELDRMITAVTAK